MKDTLQKEKTIDSDLVILTYSDFVTKLERIFIRKFTKQKNNEILKIAKVIELEDIPINNIRENLITKLNRQKENLIVLVDFKESFQIDSELIQLKWFRNLLEIINKHTSYKNVVNIISEIGVLGDATHYFRALQYAAVINIAQAYALKLGSSDIRVNNICLPEYFSNPNKSTISDEFSLTLSNLTKFLLSSSSNNITGQTVSLSKELLR